METDNLPNADRPIGAEATPGSAPLDAESSAPMSELPGAITGSEAVPSNAPVAQEPEAEEEYDDEAPEEQVADRSWTRFLPVVFIGVLMFLLGGMGGFMARPIIMPPPPTPTPVVVQQQQQPQPADAKALLAELISKTRHFKGSPNAPVTLLEFADFQ